MPYSLSILPVIVALGDPVLVSLTRIGKERRRVTRWDLHHEGLCQHSLPFPGDPVPLTLTNLGVSLLSAENPAGVNGNRVLGRRRCLVADSFTLDLNECLKRKYDPSLDDLRKVCETHEIPPLEENRRLDVSLSSLLRVADENGRHVLFSLLCDLHAPWARKTARYRGFRKNGMVTAQDIYHDGCVRALVALDRFIDDPEGRPFGPWFRTIIRRLMIDVLRRLGTERSRRVPLFDDVVGRMDPDSMNDVAEAIHRVVAHLSPAEQELRTLSMVEGWTLEQLANQYGVSVSTMCRRNKRLTLRLQTLYLNLPSDIGGGG
ncbi:MAG: sigma-70 family RNA polymerase sigma factor [Gemmataceae bacterium]